MNQSSRPPHVVIATPAWADANNGNWQTARRWARHLAGSGIVQLIDHWPGGRVMPVSGPSDARPSQADVLIALHARRSADAVRAWHEVHGAHGLAVVLTGTDLYKDLPAEAAGAGTVYRSLERAFIAVVLQDQALQDLPREFQRKTRVIFQSTTARRSLDKSMRPGQDLRAIMVGHLREEKDPRTLQRAAALLRPEDGIRIAHIGSALDPALASLAQVAQSACPHYRWRGARTHEQTRRLIQRAHVLVHTSRLEGGAHVIMEALRSGTPVLASRIAGNIGMLGAGYEGYFEVGDARGLAQALQRFKHDAALRIRLTEQCRQRATLFDPTNEAAGLRALVQDLLQRA